jgi:hypothetical protein
MHAAVALSSEAGEPACMSSFQESMLSVRHVTQQHDLPLRGVGRASERGGRAGETVRADLSGESSGDVRSWWGGLVGF